MKNKFQGKNILFADYIKIINNFEEGTFNKNLISNENESKIIYISMNLLIKKIALYNFRVVYPLLYRAFLQQYYIFLSIPLFIQKIMQAFELYYNNDNKITNVLINLLNKVVLENYDKIKDEFFLIYKIKKILFI